MCFVPSLSAYLDIYKSETEQSKINVHISAVEQTLPTFLSQRERGGNHRQRVRVLKFCSTALQLLKPQSVNIVNVPC